MCSKRMTPVNRTVPRRPSRRGRSSTHGSSCGRARGRRSRGGRVSVSLHRTKRTPAARSSAVDRHRAPGTPRARGNRRRARRRSAWRRDSSRDRGAAWFGPGDHAPAGGQSRAAGRVCSGVERDAVPGPNDWRATARPARLRDRHGPHIGERALETVGVRLAPWCGERAAPRASAVLPIRRTRSRNDRGGSDEWGNVGEHAVRRRRSRSGPGCRPRRRPRVGRDGRASFSIGWASSVSIAIDRGSRWRGKHRRVRRLAAAAAPRDRTRAARRTGRVADAGASRPTRVGGPAPDTGGRVLEARHERGLAASCAAQLGWIERARGRSERALAAFARARELEASGPKRQTGIAVRAAIGAGVVWTDECRFAEAEAALRGASTAAAILGNDDLERRARRALARCLYWQRRYDEADAVLQSRSGENGGESRDAEDDALRARIAIAQNDLRLAIVSASRGLDLAERTGNDQVVASTARSMALAQAALGSGEQVQRWTTHGIQAAAHAPLAADDARGSAPSSCGRSVTTIGAAMAREKSLRAVLRRQALPALVRRELESACERAVAAGCGGSVSCDRTLHDLESFLTLVHGETDDAIGLEAVCRKLLELMRGCDGPDRDRIAGAEDSWRGRAGRGRETSLTSTACLPADRFPRTRPANHGTAAEAIRWGQDAIAVVSCRWTPGTIVDRAAVTARLKAAALAAAPAVRSLLDRSHLTNADGVAGELIGASPVALSLRDAIARAARAPFPVLIEGESGSGKELVARAMHRAGPRRDRRFCARQLRGAHRRPARGRAVRARARRVHRRGRASGPACSRRRTAARSSSTRSASCRRARRPSCCACCRKGRCGASARTCRAASTCGSSPRPIGAGRARSARGRFRADLRFRLDVVRHRRAAAARAARATSRCWPQHFWSEAAGRVGSQRDADQRRARGAGALRLAGQRARAAERDGVAGGARPAPRARGRRRAAGADRRAPRGRRRRPSRRRARTSSGATCAPRSRRPAASIARRPRARRVAPGAREDACRLASLATPEAERRTSAGLQAGSEELVLPTWSLTGALHRDRIPLGWLATSCGGCC